RRTVGRKRGGIGPRRQQGRERGVPRLVGILVTGRVRRRGDPLEQVLGPAPDARGLALQVADVDGELGAPADLERLVDGAEQVASFPPDVAPAGASSPPAPPTASATSPRSRSSSSGDGGRRSAPITSVRIEPCPTSAAMFAAGR